jgi:hypothetical protein
VRDLFTVALSRDGQSSDLIKVLVEHFDKPVWFLQGLLQVVASIKICANKMGVGWVNQHPRRHKANELLNLEVDCVLFAVASINNFPDHSEKPV